MPGEICNRPAKGLWTIGTDLVGEQMSDLSTHTAVESHCDLREPAR